MIITFCNNKGGVGKSTTAVHFAYWLEAFKDKRISFIDSDAQRSSKEWIELLSENTEVEIPCYEYDDVDKLAENVLDLEEESDYVIIDAPGGSSDITRSLIYISHVVVIPVQPTTTDLKSALKTISQVKTVRMHQSDKPLGLVFLSRAMPNSKIPNQVLESLSGSSEVKLLKTIIKQKKPISDSDGDGCTIWQMKGKTAQDSQAEYESLFDEIWKFIK